ncbi:MAG TPA: uroporphyrinogen decarboxylase [Pirellulales bacterium]
MTSASSLAGLRVVALESRRAAEMERLIERLGGTPAVSPSMREVAAAENPAAVDFANRLMSGQVDVVVLMTGVGTRHLVSQVQRHVDRQRFLTALADTITIARGPKPVAALKELDIQPSFRVPEPNTWRELLKTIDAEVPVANHVVAVQEYGKPNASLVAGLEARGATVLPIKIYSYDFPEDLAPLEANIRALAEGQVDVVLFTSAHQVVNLFRLAQRLGLSGQLHRGLSRAVVASIGPTTSEMLGECDVAVDLEPEHAKMGQLVVAAAEQAGRLLEAKRNARSPAQAAAAPAATRASDDCIFLKACRREPTDRVPIWLMRQAGRYMPEYRAVRAKQSFLELCKNPQLCAEVMLTAVERLGVDAAIIFSDLLPMLEPMGLELEFAAGEGPVIHNPVREAAHVDRVRELEEMGALSFVTDTVRLTRAGLPPEIPVIGFAGAPFTLASYVIEGGASRHYAHTKALMYGDEGAWGELMGRLARSVSRYLSAQIEAGAQAVQIFDSWVGCLGPDDYRRYVLPYVSETIAGITRGVPVIHFGTGNPVLLPLMAEAGGSVIGVDWRVRLDQAWQTIGYDRAVQGNLDPTVLLTTPAEIRSRAADVLSQAAGRPGHIFNLGHGVLPSTPVDNVIALIDAVHELGSGRTPDAP